MQLNEYFFRSLGNSGNEPRRHSECRASNDHIVENEGMLRQLSKDIKTHSEENEIMGDQNFQKAVDFKEREINMVAETDEESNLETSESIIRSRESNKRRNPVATDQHNNVLLCQQQEHVE